jgi:hypothetical protein
MPQDHLVIELAIDPFLDGALDVVEVDNHVARIERPGTHFYFGNRVVSVRMPADTLVIEQPMSVAKFDLFGDRVHSRSILANVPNCCALSAGLDSVVLAAAGELAALS